MGVFPLMQRDALYIATNGGGGYLDPLERDPEMVLSDVRDQVVSREAAEIRLWDGACPRCRRCCCDGRAPAKSYRPAQQKGRSMSHPIRQCLV